jgi:hypothetical protein
MEKAEQRRAAMATTSARRPSTARTPPWRAPLELFLLFMTRRGAWWGGFLAFLKPSFACFKALVVVCERKSQASAAAF